MREYTMQKLSILFFLGALFLIACSPEFDLPTKDVSFNQHIVPLIKYDCTPCHWAGENKIKLQGVKGDYERIKTYLVPGDSHESKFLKYAHGFKQHPVLWQEGDDTYHTVSTWIEEGAKNN